MKLLRIIANLLFNVVAGVMAGILHVGHGIKVLSLVLVDLGRASRQARGVRCPQGHRVETSGGTYECASCGWTFGQGKSIWRCANPECRAITTAISCPTCGLSVRNPFRWGRG